MLVNTRLAPPPPPHRQEQARLLQGVVEIIRQGASPHLRAGETQEGQRQEGDRGTQTERAEPRRLLLPASTPHSLQAAAPPALLHAPLHHKHTSGR